MAPANGDGGTATTPLKLHFDGANPAASMEGTGSAGTANEFFGNDPSGWRTDIPLFGGVVSHDVYPGIDLIYHGSGGGLEYDFVVAPGAQPGAIKLSFEGEDSIRIDDRGDLVVTTPGGDLVEKAPTLYQETGGVRRPVSGAFRLLGGGEVGFEVGAYDPGQALVIDPVLSFSGFIQTNVLVYGKSIARDADGNLYIAGLNPSIPGFRPTTGNPSADFPGADFGTGSIALVKLDPTGSRILYATYIGGDRIDLPFGLAVDASGAAYLTGTTFSPDFPMVNAVQSTLNGRRDAFVTKFSPSGSSIEYSTYLGGSSDEDSFAVAVDSDGSAVVVGSTYSSDFPTTNALQPTFGGMIDGFVAKLSPSGSSLVYSTYLGGSNTEDVEGVQIDASSQAVVVGDTGSADFPTDHSLQPFGGAADAFVAKLSASGDRFVYSTFLGGSNLDIALGVAVGPSGEAYVAGITGSTDFPTRNPFRASFQGPNNVFVTKINPGGTALVYSTYLGSADGVGGIGVDSLGDALVVGWTEDPDFPTVSSLQPFVGSPTDAFVTQFAPSGSSLLYSTFLGGSGEDVAEDVAVAADGTAYVFGNTDQADFPLVNSDNPFVPPTTAFLSIIRSHVMRASETTLTGDPNPSLPGQPVTFSAVVSDPSGAVVPTGSVTFYDGDVALAKVALNADGRAAFAAGLPVGVQRIRAVYSGDRTFNPSSAAIDQDVILFTTATTLTGDPNPSFPGQPVTFVAVVTDPSGRVVPTGSVTFYDGDAALGVAPLDGNGRASFTTATLASGGQTIRAVYGGDQTSDASTATFVQDVAARVDAENVRRFGFHAQPTSLAIPFTGPLDARSASDVSNYTLMDLGPDGRPNTRDDRVIALASAAYDPVAHNVVLRPSQRRIPLRHRYALTIHTGAGGVVDVHGRPIGPQAGGGSTTDPVLLFGQDALAGPSSALATKRQAIVRAARHRPHAPRTHGAARPAT